MDGARPVPPAELTGAVVLHLLTDADWPLEHALSWDDDVVRWTHYPVRLDEAGARARIARAAERARAGLTYRYAIRDADGVPLGTWGIARLDTDAPEVFYAVLPAARRRGAATAAARLLSDWVLGRFPTATLLTIVGNVASEAVARRAGFTVAEHVEDDHRGRRVTFRRWVRSA